MPNNAPFDVNEVHSIINQVNSLHQPKNPPVEPGWLEPRGGGGDDVDARTDDSKGTLTAQQDGNYAYYTESVDPVPGEYPGYGGREEMGENNDDDYEDNNDGYDQDAYEDDETISQTTAWQGSQYSSAADSTAASKYSQSTAPSYAGEEVNAAQQQQVDDLAEQEEARGPLLVCEFRDLCNCPEIFNGDETEAWIDHIGGHHLNYSFPAKSVCWFCNSHVFNSDVDKKGKRIKMATTEEEANQKYERRAQTFRQRLEHVAWHIVEERVYRYQNMRPDFDLIRHMHKYGLLDDETYNHATAYTERPPRDPKPGKQRRIKTNPPDWEPPHKILEKERRSQIIHDQSKEDRQRKKEKDSKRRDETRRSKK
ncbi:uncharacterized protein PgNI_07580 [Pyricularia grisea]|uniref:Uncharacterized protein n=1 Tax=Pyricularia grisea TaxID=148305 RepID=A0A6P8B1D7_PYRGI|nr:uncharacterized protein PgNI_07580 [Pyricularia grisea]TLD08644.1 hypothetical protein PgNI_07580 [Pyricularia grisea]